MSNDANSPWSDWTEALRDVAPFLDLGWRIAAAALVPVLVGWGLDAWMGTTPWALLGGAGLGLVAAVVTLRHVAAELERRSASPRRRTEVEQAPELPADSVDSDDGANSSETPVRRR